MRAVGGDQAGAALENWLDGMFLNFQSVLGIGQGRRRLAVTREELDPAIALVKAWYKAGEETRNMLRRTTAVNPDGTVTLYRGDMIFRNVPGEERVSVPGIGANRPLLSYSPDPDDAALFSTSLPSIQNAEIGDYFIHVEDVHVDDILFSPSTTEGVCPVIFTLK